MKKVLKIFAAAFIVINVSFAQTVPVKNINVEQFKNQISNDSNLVILDVRTPEELTGPLGKIEGVINIPVQELEKRIGELDKYKERQIAVICRTGHRSNIGTGILLKHGFKEVENVEGGMTAYREMNK